jgi:hypothetical protein
MKHTIIIGGKYIGSGKPRLLQATVESNKKARLSKDGRVFSFIPRSTGRGKLAGGIDNRKLKPSIHEDRAKGDYISFKPNNHEAKNPTSVLTGVSLSGSFLLA